MKETRFARLKWFTAAVSLLAAALSFPGAAWALDMLFAGPKALGMAGSRTASVDETTAIYYNPAALGFFGMRDESGNRLDTDNNHCGRKDWGVDIDAEGGARLHNDFATYLDTLADIDIDTLNNGVQDESELRELVEIIGNLAGIDEPGNAISVDANAGLGMRFGHFALGSRASVQASGRVLEIDDQNFGLGTADLDGQLTPITVSGNDGQIGFFTPDQVAVLGTTLTNDNIQKLDFLLRQTGADPAQSETIVNLIDSAASNLDPSVTLSDDNTTTVVLDGFGLLEVPISYGYALSKHWSIGATMKFMKGRVYGTQVFVFDDDSEEVLKQIDEEYEESMNFGVDLGIMGRYRYLQFGLVGRNLNSPEFDGFTQTTTLSNGRVVSREVDNVKLDPQVRAGLAFIPFTTLTLEADIDLTKNETTLEGYDTQYASFGIEWDAFRFLALRAGVYTNLAEDDIDLVYTAGLGLNLWAARLDVAGAFAPETTEFDEDDVPQEFRVAAALSIDF